MTVNNFKPVQAQSFALSGAGAVSGATTVILRAFEQIDGTLLTMTDFGTIGYMTLEPGNGTLEEQISFTGVTQNSGGTATLTGVKTVLMVSPYTETSGLAQTHAGSTTAVLSNTSGYYNQFPKKAVDATITGKYIFPSDDVSNAGIVADTDTVVATAFVTLGQLSRQAISGASNASTTVKGIVQLPTQAQTDARTTTGSTGALLAITPDVVRSTLLSDYVVATGTANAIAIAPTPAITAYAAGQTFTFKASATNTLTTTLAVSGLTTQTIMKGDGTATLAPGDITSGQLVMVQYDGTNFQMLSPVNVTPSGTMTMYAGASAPAGWLLCDGTSYLRTTYPTLFTAISTTFGAVDGTHFSVPDMRGRAPIGVGTGTGGGASGTGIVTGGSALTARALSAWVGEETHVLSVGELAAHTHGIAGQTGSATGNSPTTINGGNGGAASDTTQSNGSGTAHNTMQPVLSVNFAIKI